MSKRRDSREEEDMMRIMCGALLLRHVFIDGKEVLKSNQGAQTKAENGEKIKLLQRLEAEHQA